MTYTYLSIWLGAYALIGCTRAISTICCSPVAFDNTYASNQSYHENICADRNRKLLLPTPKWGPTKPNPEQPYEWGHHQATPWPTYASSCWSVA
jgi:hypothetical protein